jgi:L-threonylcarbamoyladenylate synthase
MLKDEVTKALEVVRAGGIILYPTDTVWGLGCDATNPEAVEKIFRLKGRDSGKSLIVLLDTASKLPSYVSEVPDIAYDLIEYAENPLTIVYSGAKNLADNVVAADRTIGIRVTSHPFCKELISRMRVPLVSTSANVSGQPGATDFNSISDEILHGVDYVADFGRDQPSAGKPSTIIRLESDGRFKFLRR